MSPNPFTGLDRMNDPEQLRRWLESLPEEPSRRLAEVELVLRRIHAGALPPDPAFEALESVRLAVVPAAVSLLRTLPQSVIPLPAAEAAQLGLACRSLEALQAAYRGVYTQMVETDNLDTRSVIPGAANALRIVLPLARALDAASRQASWMLRARVAVGVGQWRTLALLAQHLRESTFLDERLIDPIAALRPLTARALFMHPVLLLLADCTRRTAAEVSVLDKLARRWAGRVGFRLHGGRVATDNPQGPALRLTPEHALRLDTHRLLESLAAKRDEWLAPDRAAGRAALGLASERFATLLDELFVLWSARHGRERPIVPPFERVRLRFGLPALLAAPKAVEGDGAGASGAGHETPDAAALAYTYGRWERNTIVRIAIGGSRPDPVIAMFGDAETAAWVSVCGERVVIERRLAVPAPRLGCLIALRPIAAGAAAGGPGAVDTVSAVRESGPLLGIVDSIEQMPPVVDSARPPHRIGLTLLKGAAEPIGVRTAATVEFVDAFRLAGDPDRDELPSLIVPLGLVGAGERIALRDAHTDATATVVDVTARGPGYERVTIRAEG